MNWEWNKEADCATANGESGMSYVLELEPGRIRIWTLSQWAEVPATRWDPRDERMVRSRVGSSSACLMADAWLWETAELAKQVQMERLLREAERAASVE